MHFLQKVRYNLGLYAITCFIKASVCPLLPVRDILYIQIDYRFITIQTGLVMTYLAFILYENTVEMENWVLNIYDYYAIPFQVIIPLFIWVWAEIKNRISKNPKEKTANYQSEETQ